MNDRTSLNKKPAANPYIEKTEHSAGFCLRLPALLAAAPEGCQLSPDAHCNAF
jgi:hypothetical protein